MMLKLKNFQCHRESVLELAPLTFLVGPSNTGKSAYVRAIGFLTGQLSLGANRLVTRGQKTMSVELSMNEHTYERILDKEGVHCRANDIVYPRMGINVPEEFTKLATIQFQFEPFFLIVDTPSDVFKKISSVLDLEKLDNITKLITTDHNTLKSQLKIDLDTHQVLTQRLQMVERIHNSYRLLEQTRFATLLVLTRELVQKLTIVNVLKWHLFRRLQTVYTNYVRVKFLYTLKVLHTLRNLAAIIISRKFLYLKQLRDNLYLIRLVILRAYLYKCYLYTILFNRAKMLVTTYTIHRILLNLRKIHVYLLYIEYQRKYVGARLIYGIYGLYLHILRLRLLSNLGQLEQLKSICEKIEKIRNRVCPTCGQTLPIEVSI